MAIDPFDSDTRSTVLEESLVFSGLRHGWNLLARPIDRSHVAGAGRWTRSAISSSWLYRWLTKVPEPEVIVIDLRETLTVGPLIALLDRSITILAPWVLDSRLSSIVATGVSTFHRSPIRVVSVIVLGFTLLRMLTSLLAGALGTLELGVGVIVLIGSILGLTIDHSVAELRDTRVMQTIVALLEPPEAPMNDDEPPPAENDTE